MSATTEEVKTRPLIFRTTSDLEKQLRDYEKNTHQKSFSGAVNSILEAFFLSGLHAPTQKTPPRCRECPKNFGECDSGVACGTKKSVLDFFNFKIVPFAIAEKCAEKPFNTPIDKKTREQFETELTATKEQLFQVKELYAVDHEKLGIFKGVRQENDDLSKENKALNRQIAKLSENKLLVDNESLAKRWKQAVTENAEIPKLKEELEHVKKEKEEGDLELGNVRNGLLATQEENTNLHMDNEYLRRENEKLQENEILKENKKLLDENDSLNETIVQKAREKADVAEEVLKLQALLKEERNQKTDIISRIDRMLREMEQHMPPVRNQLSGDALEFKIYVDTLRKAIQNFRGYLRTVTA